MSSSPSPSRAAPSNSARSEAMRRKLRKGTHSCWECKRRKIRCIFDQLTDATTCNGCRRRGATCISQEFPEDDSLDGVVRAETRHTGSDGCVYGRTAPTTLCDNGRADHDIPTPMSIIAEPSRYLAFYKSSEVSISDSDIVMMMIDCSH